MVVLSPTPHPATTSVSTQAASASRGIGLTEEDLCLAIERLGDGLELGGRLGQLDQFDVRAAQGGHLPPLALVGGIDRMQAEARGEHAVEGSWRTAPLNVTEHGGAGLVARALLDLALEPVGDSAEPDVAEGIGRRA